MENSKSKALKKKKKLAGHLVLSGYDKDGIIMRSDSARRGTEVSKLIKEHEAQGLSPKLEKLRNTKFTHDSTRLNK